MTLGSPEISIEGLNEFAAVLASHAGESGSEEHKFQSLRQKEKGCARSDFAQVRLSFVLELENHNHPSASGTKREGLIETWRIFCWKP